MVLPWLQSSFLWKIVVDLAPAADYRQNQKRNADSSWVAHGRSRFDDRSS
jgi:hypothetical protein